MFKCQCCHKSKAPGVSPVRVLLEVRNKVYTRRANSQRARDGKLTRHDPGGKGWEIVKEERWCRACVYKGVQEGRCGKVVGYGR